MNITLCDTGQYIHMSMLQTHQNVRKWNSQHPLKKKTLMNSLQTHINRNVLGVSQKQPERFRCVTETIGTFSV